MSTPKIPEWFLKLAGFLISAFPSWKPTEETIVSFWITLSDLPEEALRLGALKAMRESQFPPTPADWRRQSVMFTRDFKPTAGEVWDEMRRNRRRYSIYASHEQNSQIKWSSEAVRRAAEAVNWTDPNWESEQIPTIRAQFERYYNALIARQTEADAVSDVRALDISVAGLIGRHDFGDGPKRLMGGAS